MEEEEDPDTEKGREECISSSWGGPGNGRELRVCSGGLPVRRPADAVRVEGEPRVVGGDSAPQEGVKGVDLDTEKNDDIIASQEDHEAAGPAGGVARGEAHSDGPRGSRSY